MIIYFVRLFLLLLVFSSKQTVFFIFFNLTTNQLVVASAGQNPQICDVTFYYCCCSVLHKYSSVERQTTWVTNKLEICDVILLNFIASSNQKNPSKSLFDNDVIILKHHLLEGFSMKPSINAYVLLLVKYSFLIINHTHLQSQQLSFEYSFP